MLCIDRFSVSASWLDQSINPLIGWSVLSRWKRLFVEKSFIRGKGIARSEGDQKSNAGIRKLPGLWNHNKIERREREGERREREREENYWGIDQSINQFGTPPISRKTNGQRASFSGFRRCFSRSLSIVLIYPKEQFNSRLALFTFRLTQNAKNVVILLIRKFSNLKQIKKDKTGIVTSQKTRNLNSGLFGGFYSL